MDEKAAKAQIRRLQALSKKWIGPIGLKWWEKIDIVYSREGLGKREDDTPVLARTWADHRYQSAEITFSLPMCAKRSDEELESDFVHELTHLPLARLGWLLRSEMKPRLDEAQAAVEETTTIISRMLRWARTAGRRDANPGPPRKGRRRR